MEVNPLFIEHLGENKVKDVQFIAFRYIPKNPENLPHYFNVVTLQISGSPCFFSSVHVDAVSDFVMKHVCNETYTGRLTVETEGFTLKSSRFSSEDSGNLKAAIFDCCNIVAGHWALLPEVSLIMSIESRCDEEDPLYWAYVFLENSYAINHLMFISPLPHINRDYVKASMSCNFDYDFLDYNGKASFTEMAESEECAYTPHI